MTISNGSIAGNPNEFTAVLVAFFCSGLLALFHAGLLRCFRKVEGVRLMGFAFLSSLASWVLIMRYVKKGVMPSLSEWLAGCSFAGTMLLCYAQVYSLTCRGFSLRILVDIYRHGSLSFTEVCEKYGDGRGIDWLLDKRIDGLVALGLVRRKGDVLEVDPAYGWAAGRMACIVRKVLKLGGGG